MNKALLLGLGALGLLLASSPAKATPAPFTFPPIPPPPLPPPLAPSRPVATRPKYEVDVGPAVIEEIVPRGWIPARPTPEIESIRRDMQSKLGASPPGTRFPFQLPSGNYLATILPDGKVAILQPEDQG